MKKSTRKAGKAEAFDIEAMFDGVKVELGSTAPPVARAVSFADQINGLLEAAMTENVNTSALDKYGERITHGEAAKELYHIMMLAGSAIVELAKKKPERLRGIGRGHHHTFIPYDGKMRAVDVAGWLGLVELGADFRKKLHKDRGRCDPKIANVVDDALRDLCEWRELRGRGEKAAPILKSAAEFKDELKRPTRKREKVPKPEPAKVEIGGIPHDESLEDFQKRESYTPELNLIDASKRLPPLRGATGSKRDIWEAAVLAWLTVRFGSAKSVWQENPYFDGVAKAGERNAQLAKKVKVRFGALIR